MYLARLALVGLCLLPTAAPAQVDSPGGNQGVRVLTHTFHSPSREFVRVRLVANETYRAQLDQAQFRLEVRPVNSGVQIPRLRRVQGQGSLPRYSIEPRVTAEYELRVLGGGDDKVRLEVDRRTRQP